MTSFLVYFELTLLLIMSRLIIRIVLVCTIILLPSRRCSLPYFFCHTSTIKKDILDR